LYFFKKQTLCFLGYFTFLLPAFHKFSKSNRRFAFEMVSDARDNFIDLD